MPITEKQAQKLGLEPRSHLSPVLEKCGLRLCANESYQNAEEELEALTGVKLGHSTLHRLAQALFIECKRKTTPTTFARIWTNIVIASSITNTTKPSKSVQLVPGQSNPRKEQIDRRTKIEWCSMEARECSTSGTSSLRLSEWLTLCLKNKNWDAPMPLSLYLLI